MSKKFIQNVLTTCFAGIPFALQAATVSVTSTANTNTTGTLPYALLNANNGDTIDLTPIAGQTILLNSPLPAITKSYTIQGAGSIIDGASTYQGLSVAFGSPIIQNLTIQNAVSQGGNGGSAQCGGGGGVGGGGALYVHTGNTVTINTMSLNNNQAIGGAGGNGIFLGSNSDQSGGGGGGFGGGDGGTLADVSPYDYGAGGGGGHPGGGIGAGTVTGAGNGLYFAGAGGGNDRQVAGNSNGFVGGGIFGGGAGSGGNGQVPTFGEIAGAGGLGIGYDSQFGGGGGGGDEAYGPGSGLGAGGGGGNYYAGGNGGPLGGGGGGGYYYPGNGGFGAGGGGSEGPGGIGGGGFLAGGGNGGSSLSSAGGGGGSGLGGAIFVQNSATLVIQDGLELSGNSVTAGLGGSAPAGAPGTPGLAMGTDIFIRQGGQVVFDLNGSLNVANPIAGDQSFGPKGAGGVVKAGLGTLALNGTNTYAGETRIESGILGLNGSVAGDVFVNTSGIFSGNANVGGDLYSYGIVAPGNSIGIITTTNLILGPTSVLEIEVNNAGQSDQIIASGAASINGELEIIPLAGTYSGPVIYTIITAPGGVTGAFSSVASTTFPAFVLPIYDPTAVLVEVLPLSALDISGNAAAAAACYLETPFAPGSDGATVLAALLASPISEIESAFSYIDPSNYSALAWTQIQNALLVRSSYSQHLELLDLECCCNGLHFWADGMGQWMQQNAQNSHFGFHDFTGGITVGADACCNEALLGIAFSYTYSDLRWQRAAGHSQINSYYAGLYGSWDMDCFYANVAAIGAFSQYSTKRALVFSTIDRHARSDHNSWEGLAGGEIGYDWRGAFGCMDLIPFVRVDYVYLAQQRHSETGALSLDINLNSHNDQFIQTEAGIVFTNRELCSGWLCDWTLVPLLKLSYINQTSLSGRNYGANFTGSTCHFNVSGWDFERNLGGISLALDGFNCCETMGVSLRYDGQFGSKYWVQSANLSLDYKF